MIPRVSLLLILFLWSIPMTGWATTCYCYFGEKNDCQEIGVKANAKIIDCELACKNYHKESYKKSTFAETGWTDITKLTLECSSAHIQATPIETKPDLGAVIPKLNVNIPTVTFSPIIRVGEDLKINFLANYIEGIYKYLIFISGFLAIVFVLIGGLQWILGAVSPSQIASAKKRMKNGVIGLVLIFGVALILQIVNPQLVTFNPLTIERIEKIELPLVTEIIEEEGEKSSTPDHGVAEVVDAPGNHKKAAGPDTRLSNQDIKTAANKNNIDECFLWAFAKKESGGRLHAIGHDENYPSTNKPVGARKDFLMSGKKISGIEFPLPTTGLFNYKTMNNHRVYNDDKFQPNNPPHYGIDWRYSHGIGYIQLTIFPKKNNTMGKLIQGPNGSEWARKVRGKWYTVTDLLNADSALEASIRFFGSECGKKSTVVAGMKCARVSNAAMGRALDKYQKCPLAKKMSISTDDLKTYPAKGSH